MSVKAMNKVWEFSRAKGSELLVMLCYADFADDNGLGACPALKTLAAKTRLTRQGVREVRDRLVAKGEICIRPDPSQYDTDWVDIVYGDGSNQAVIESIHSSGKSFTVSTKDLPKQQKFVPDSLVVVSSDSSLGNESDNTTTDLGVKDLPNGKSFTSPPTDNADNPDQTAVADLLAEWEERAIQGAYLSEVAEKVQLRPDWRAEVDDIQDYRDACNLAQPNKPLGPGWEASQYQALASRSPNSPRLFCWMDYAPAKPSRPEYWRPWTGTAEPSVPVEVELEPAPTNADALHLWASALSELELSFPAPTFETCFKPVRALVLDGDTLTIAVNDHYGKQWLAKFDREIKRALQRAAGRAVEYRIEVQEQTTREDAA